MYWKGQQYTISGSPCTAAEPSAPLSAGLGAGAACHRVKQHGDEIEAQRTNRYALTTTLMPCYVPACMKRVPAGGVRT